MQFILNCYAYHIMYLLSSFAMFNFDNVLTQVFGYHVLFVGICTLVKTLVIYICTILIGQCLEIWLHDFCLVQTVQMLLHYRLIIYS